MKGQKLWNFLAIVAVGLLVLGCLAGKANVDIVGKCFIIFGALVFIASMVGSNRTYKKHPYKCPMCGSQVRPVGRRLPGVGFNGTNTITCPHCGGTIHIQDLNQE